MLPLEWFKCYHSSSPPPKHTLSICSLHSHSLPHFLHTLSSFAKTSSLPNFARHRVELGQQVAVSYCPQCYVPYTCGSTCTVQTNKYSALSKPRKQFTQRQRRFLSLQHADPTQPAPGTTGQPRTVVLYHCTVCHFEFSVAASSSRDDPLATMLRQCDSPFARQVNSLRNQRRRSNSGNLPGAKIDSLLRSLTKTTPDSASSSSSRSNSAIGSKTTLPATATTLGSKRDASAAFFDSPSVRSTKKQRHPSSADAASLAAAVALAPLLPKSKAETVSAAVEVAASAGRSSPSMTTTRSTPALSTPLIASPHTAATPSRTPDIRSSPSAMQLSSKSGKLSAARLLSSHSTATTPTSSSSSSPAAATPPVLQHTRTLPVSSPTTLLSASPSLSSLQSSSSRPATPTATAPASTTPRTSSKKRRTSLKDVVEKQLSKAEVCV